MTRHLTPVENVQIWEDVEHLELLKKQDNFTRKNIVKNRNQTNGKQKTKEESVKFVHAIPIYKDEKSVDQ